MLRILLRDKRDQDEDVPLELPQDDAKQPQDGALCVSQFW